MAYVHLSGGPRDGTVIDWHGGDLINMAPEVGISITPVRGGAVEIGAVQPELYRRSLRTSTIFVWQP